MPAFTPYAVRPYFDEVQYQVEAGAKSPLKNRDVRNAYEHLDDRLDRTLSQGEPSIIVDRGIGPTSAWSVPGKKIIKRLVDPAQAVLTVMNTELHLTPLIREVQRLERRLIAMKLQGFNPQTGLTDQPFGANKTG